MEAGGGWDAAAGGGACEAGGGCPYPPGGGCWYPPRLTDTDIHVCVKVSKFFFNEELGKLMVEFVPIPDKSLEGKLRAVL